ncbi:MAG: putative colanic acid biosynthesis acetyltransferase [Bacteroidales bacterium]|nr:putative colanic acid biosynthesis acetyltransferase [Bacteroidales bacterium]HPO65612.1 putative colanic acid biosynthesis acetyltransferase [Bacteroidales bacterium]
MSTPRFSVDLSRYDNSWYHPGRSAWLRALWYLTNEIFFRSGMFPFSSFKCWLLRRFGAEVGRGAVIKPHVNIKYPWKLRVGNYCWIGEGVWIDNLAEVTLGNHVCISQGAMLLTGNHNYRLPTFDLMVRPIVLEDGVWIGAQATVCPGVTAASHAVLTVGSVATQNLESYCIYSGNPAQKIKSRL